MTILFVDLLVRGYFSLVATHQQRLDHYSNIVSVHSAVHSQLLAAHFWQQLYFLQQNNAALTVKIAKKYGIWLNMCNSNAFTRWQYRLKILRCSHHSHSQFLLRFLSSMLILPEATPCTKSEPAASAFRKISRGYQNFGCSSSTDPHHFSLLRCFWHST